MPINLLNYTGKADGELPDKLERLCEDEWSLPAQIECLEKWLGSVGKTLKPGSYVADIGFAPREGGFGGGAVLTHEAMAIMATVGMNLLLSEYPSSGEDAE